VIITRLPVQKSINPVSEYFGAVASGYDDAVRTWPWSIIRRIEARAVRQAIGNIGDANALDLGCGSGYYTRILLETGARHVTAVDLSDPMLRNLPATGVTAIQSSADTFESDMSYDIICIAGLIEFVNDPAQLLENARRLVSDDGRLVLLGPRRSLRGDLYRLFHTRNGIEISLFTDGELRRLAAKTGWRSINLRSVFPFSFVTTMVPSS
jgi:SAM-dependent methyltransferase